jgi:CRISPR-associated protein Cmr2
MKDERKGDMHVLALALGPVQDFIAAARRTRDLWFGSWLLSEMARAAGKAIERTFGAGSLIFPSSGRLQDPDATFANKIVARIAGTPEEADRLVRSAIQARLGELRDKAFANVQDHPAFEPNRTRAMAQIDDLIEIQWASAPEGAGGYDAARREAERLLGARKQSRLFGPVTWGAEVPKSSIDGQRESVIDERAFETPEAIELYRTFRIEAAERLCGVSLLKRLGQRDSKRYDAHHFLSTGHLAAGPLLERLRALSRDAEKDRKLESAWREIVSALQQAGVDLSEQRVYVRETENPYLGFYDAGLLFESRLPDLFAEEKEPRKRRQRAAPILAKVNAFLDVAGVSTPCPYFAILHADGDRMGTAIDSIRDPRQHQELSSHLSGFADSAREIIEKDFSGELVYAGGDDVLAFVPLHRVVRCARALADDFAGRLAPCGAAGAPPTLSVGVAVVHFLEPLQRAIALARRAESKAKEARDRFAAERNEARGGFAISFDKRSGPVLQLAGTWGDLDVEIEKLTAFHAEDRIPDKAGYELRALARLTHDAGEVDGAQLKALAGKEAERILRRKQPRRGEDEGVEQEVLAHLAAMLEKAPNLDAFADRLIGSRLLAEARLQSQIEAPEETSE